MKSHPTVPTDHEVDEASTTSRAGRRTAAVMAVTVGATAAATALAAPADAKDGKFHVWDKVANCESTNNWDINTGNGFYGGLQFTDSTWDAHGGEKYAGRADNATRMEQIQVARRVLKSQGPDAWPVCGPNAGLTKASGHATGKKLPKDAADGTATSGKHRQKAEQHAKPTHHKAKHAKGDKYTVRSGDTLAKIARKKNVDGGWKALYKANKHKIHSANVIHVGQVLHLPS